jgi:hypothetical protein
MFLRWNIQVYKCLYSFQMRNFNEAGNGNDVGPYRSGVTWCETFYTRRASRVHLLNGALLQELVLCAIYKVQTTWNNLERCGLSQQLVTASCGLFCAVLLLRGVLMSVIRECVPATSPWIVTGICTSYPSHEIPRLKILALLIWP